jgi:hypothetical protein
MRASRYKGATGVALGFTATFLQERVMLIAFEQAAAPLPAPTPSPAIPPTAAYQPQN